jgi:hypothetical protein
MELATALEWDRAIEEIQRLGTFDFQDPELVAVAIYLALRSEGLWEEEPCEK